MLTLKTFHTTDPETAYQFALSEMYRLQKKAYEEYYNSRLELQHTIYQQEGEITALNIKIDAMETILKEKEDTVKSLQSSIEALMRTIETQQTAIQKISCQK